ncbi:MAG: S-methyl-5'-thioadenosine phosphorylase [Acidimicrobiales bacterium]
MSRPAAEIGVFGGSGFYAFMEDVTTVAVHTPYGSPSAPLSVGTVGDRRVAFMPRHGAHHELPPHRVNYRANVWAMAELGVRRIIGPCAAGSLQPHIHPGEFVVCDQLVDRTSGRADTYFDGGVVGHISFADPYCPDLRSELVGAARAEGITVHDRGTVVVIGGPRFSTRAESGWYRSAGWEVVNMTQYPEAYLARELGLCYAAVALITDYDTGLEGVDGIEPVTMDVVFEVLRRNVERTRALLFSAIPRLAAEPPCTCAAALSSGPLHQPRREHGRFPRTEDVSSGSPS